MGVDAPALVRTGNLEDDFAIVGLADWVIEVIVEDLAAKRALMQRIDAVRSENTIVSTNTSGIPISSIAAGFSEGFRQHFLGTHFFNPPRYLKLLEVIPTSATSPEVVKFISHFAEYRLGKGVVLCKDTPNFIANRLGFGGGAFAVDYILENGYTVEEVDAITGPVIGHPKTATFRLIDLVGVDVWEHVGRNLAPAIPHDGMAQRYLGSERTNILIHEMVKRGWLGNKTKQGFYKESRTPDGGKDFLPLNLKTLEYEPPSKPRFASIGKVKDIDSLGERIKLLMASDDRAAQLVQALTYQGLAYAAACIPEIADSPRPVDDAMRWGFGHEAGPFETWDLLGVKETAICIQEAGFSIAAWVNAMLAAGCPTFYQYDGDRKVGVFNPVLGDYEAIPRDPAIILLKEEKAAGNTLAENPGASLVDLGEGVLNVEFHTKMNILDDDVFNMIETGLNRVEKDYEGLVIGNNAENFSAGANLFLVVMAAQGGMWDQLDAVVNRMQSLNMRMRYFPKPVVAGSIRYEPGGRSRNYDPCQPDRGRFRAVFWFRRDGRRGDPGWRRHKGAAAARVEPGDAYPKCRCSALPAAHLRADRHRTGIHKRR